MELKISFDLSMEYKYNAYEERENLTRIDEDGGSLGRESLPCLGIGMACHELVVFHSRELRNSNVEAR
jgi:hypothetical protein